MTMSYEMKQTWQNVFKLNCYYVCVVSVVVRAKSDQLRFRASSIFVSFIAFIFFFLLIVLTEMSRTLRSGRSSRSPSTSRQSAGVDLVNFINIPDAQLNSVYVGLHQIPNDDQRLESFILFLHNNPSFVDTMKTAEYTSDINKLIKLFKLKLKKGNGARDKNLTQLVEHAHKQAPIIIASRAPPQPPITQNNARSNDNPRRNTLQQSSNDNSDNDGDHDIEQIDDDDDVSTTRVAFATPPRRLLHHRHPLRLSRRLLHNKTQKLTN